MIKIGVFTVSTPDYTPNEALKKLSKIGYDGVEWRVTTDTGDKTHPSFWSGNRTTMSADDIITNAGDLLETAKKYHIQMPSLGAYIDCKDLAAVENHFTAAQAIGAKSVRVGCAGFDKTRTYADQLAEIRDQYACVAALAEKYEIRALIETHMGAFTPTIPLAMNVLRGLNPKYTGIMWDPGNEVYEGRERYDYALSIAGEYLGEVHMKNAKLVPNFNDNGTLCWSTEAAQIQAGVVNWTQVFEELKNIGYDGWIMFEDFSTVQPLEERLSANLKYARKLLK